MRRALAILAAVLGLLIIVLCVRAASLESRQIRVEPAPSLALDADAMVARLSAGLRFPTISHQDPAQLPAAEFERFHRYLEASFPRLHGALRRELVAGHSLLYTWPGRRPELAPLLLLAHQDVVPVEPGTEERWTHPPFEGRVADGFVWGRGAIDDKGALFAVCEAVEWLIAHGFEPERTLLLAFGHDEEVGGTGAATTAETLAQRGIRPELVLDEGLAVVEGVVPGLERPLALIGVAEKGYVTVTLTVDTPGGHSSTPPPHTAVGTLATAIHRLERAPMPAGIRGPTADFFAYLAPELPFSYRIPFANVWLFGGVLERALARSRAVNANLRTTTAVTMIQGSVKENVLPARARAGVNFRILPGDTSQDVLEHVRRAIDDPAVELAFAEPPREASPVSPIDGTGFALLQRTIAEVFPDAIVAPGLVLGGTDARNYTSVSEQVFRFNPFVFSTDDLNRAHGTDERMAVAHYVRGVRWFVRLIENASAVAAR
jgi:carboxypeptidase PM20D1